MTPYDFTADQEAAIEQVERWRKDRYKPYLTLGGFAGTGKTTLVKYFAESWPGVAVATLCAKAASVLIEKGVAARTIHGLIYIPFFDAARKVRYRRRFNLGATSELIVDESSMIDHVLLQDILAFDLPVLFVGDHGQLEPVGADANLMHVPDIRLETIHRQAQDNPIVRVATAFREGRPVRYWHDNRGRLSIARPSDFWRLLSPDYQMVCGFNKTRHRVNALVRGNIGAEGGLPISGEKLICVQNNTKYGIFNGQQVVCRDVLEIRNHWLEMDVELANGTVITVPCSREQFGHNTTETLRDRSVVLFDYGYCITAHKAQGSEWDNVLAVEEIGSAWDAKRWRYTVATRARKRLIYCMSFKNDRIIESAQQGRLEAV